MCAKYKFSFSKTKWQRVIILSVLLSIFSVLNAQNSGQKISLNVHNVSIKDFIKQIESKTKYTVVYRDLLIDDKKDISITVVDKTVSEILKEVFGQKGLQAVFNNNTIVITKKNAEPQVISKSKTVSGIVLDEKGEPVIGASVIIPGTQIGVATDINGRFTLEVPSDARLRISYIGYEAKEEELEASSDMKISLEQTPKVLTETVITAQAIGQKNAILKQISSNTIKNVISAEKLQQNPDVNAIEAIGRLPGISVDRSGGEGAGFKIRGLDQSYSSVTINGEPFPVGLNAISTYALQGVEVYKSLTSNLEANAVAGTIDLTLRETPKGLHYSLMAQSGYNALNNDFGNYNIVGQVSNRFFNDKLGVFLSLNTDRVNRSTELMSVGYNTNYTTNLGDPFYISSLGFNINERINYKQSAVLSLDFVASSSTTLNFQTFASASNSYSSNQSKYFGTEGSVASVPISVNMSEAPEHRNYGITSNLSGSTNFRFLNSTLNYGISYSNNKLSTPGLRSWNYSSTTRANGLLRDSLKVYSPAQVADHFDDVLSNLEKTELMNMSYDQTQANNWSLTPRLDYEIPFKTGLLTGKIQIGVKYRLTHNYVGRTVGTAAAGSNAVFEDYINKNFDWSKGVPAVGLVVSGQENSFLGGDYVYGDKYSFDRNNLVFDKWQQHGKDNYLSASTGGLGDNPQYSGFVYDLNSSAMSDLTNNQHYAAGYIMPEINIGKWVMLIPGMRYEYLGADIKAYQGHEVTRTYSVYEDIVSAFGLVNKVNHREDKFLLPMIHLRVKPTKWFYTHFSYTHTLRRPDYSSVAAFEYYSSQDASSYSYTAGNPNLKTELWRSYDLQFTFYGKKLGLFSITAFNKTVQDKLWARSYKRIQGEPIPNPVFKDNDLVNMTVYENHPNEILLRGLEAEWQTSLGYLPKPFSYLTLSVNYTYTYGKSPNPYTKLFKYKPAGSRYELTGRNDSVVIEPMTGIPEHMANATLGIEIKAFKAYLSYQYSSQKIQSTHPNDLRLYVISEPYARLDFNASYGFNFKNNGTLEVLFKAANLTNSEDRIRYRDEQRPISVEQYGVTADLGLRYKF